MGKKKKSKKVFLRQKAALPYVLAGFLFLLLLVVGTFFYFSNHVLPNVVFAGKNYAGLTRNEVLSNVNRRYMDSGDINLKFNTGHEEISLAMADLGISYDAQATAESIFESGRNSKFLINPIQLFKSKSVRAAYSVDYGQFLSTINRSFSFLESSPTDASIFFDQNGASIKPAIAGKYIDKESFYSSVRRSIENLGNYEISLKIFDAPANVGDDGAKLALERANKLLRTQINFSFGLDKWTLSGKSLFDLLTFSPIGSTRSGLITTSYGDQSLTIVRMDVAAEEGKILDVGIDELKADSYLLSIAKVIDKPKRDATLKFENGKVSEFKSAQDGQELDRTLTKKFLLEKLSVANRNLDSTLAIALPVSVTKADIANREVNSMGIRELIASGVSYFAGSIPNRAFNIGLGSSLVNGTLIKPGDIFSFDNLVGPVSKDQGFKQAYVINKGRTVLDDGGGICQVSTTVFRAALNAGLPIVKRTAHAYRVGYYEQNGFKAGLDATIFSPSVDLQFKNDTDHYLLVQSNVDPANSRIQVDIYGTRDGRTVSLTEPVISSIVPAPEPKYQDEPTLPKGVTKQVDFAAAGATSVFSRKVYRGRNLILNDTFRSNYRPWQAVYLVGTGV